MESEHFPGVIVNPVRGLSEIFPGDFLKVRSFRVTAAGHSILLLIGSPLAGSVRMAVVENCPLFLATET